MSDPAAILAAHGLRFAALGSAAAPPHLDLTPLGVEATFLDAAREPGWVERYHAVNLARFGGPLALPGWVLADLYLLPSAIGLVLDPAARPRTRSWPPTTPPLARARHRDRGVAAVAARGPRRRLRRQGADPGDVRARVQRGITQWRSRALRVHTRFGPLVVEGPAPAVHGAAAESFVYRVVLGAPSPKAPSPCRSPRPSRARTPASASPSSRRGSTRTAST